MPYVWELSVREIRTRQRLRRIARMYGEQGRSFIDVQRIPRTLGIKDTAGVAAAYLVGRDKWLAPPMIDNHAVM